MRFAEFAATLPTEKQHLARLFVENAIKQGVNLEHKDDWGLHWEFLEFVIAWLEKYGWLRKPA